MAGFDNNAITIKGAIAIAALVAGGTLEFTRIAVGDGKLGTGQTPIMMENLVHWLFDVPIHEVRSDSEAQATVLGAFSNEDNETEYYYRELGLFAKDPATGAEILYCYANAGDDAEKIPAAGGSSLLEKEVRIVTLIGNATEVTAKLASGIYATQEMTKAWLALKADIDAKAEEGGRVVASQMRFDPSQTLYVDAAASATDADGTEAKPFKTIQAAVDAAYRGADLIKIEIKPGTYAENVKTPTGTGSSWVFEKNGTGTVSAKSFAIDIAPYVRIEGLTLTPDAAGRAIRLVNVASAAIESNTINGNATGFGLSIFRGSARLNGNRIDNAGTAIYAAEGAQVTSIGTIGEGNGVGLHAEGAIILQHADANVVATTPFKASNGGAVNVEGGASSFPSSFGQMSSLGSFSTAAALRDRLLSELAKLKAGEWRMFSFQQTISGGFGALGSGQTSHVHMQKTAGETNSYGMLTFFSHASAPVSAMRVSNGAFTDSVPIVLIDETRIATAERYGIMKAATPDVVIDEDVDDAAITPAVYHDVSDFRHKSTAYKVGDRVRCMFDMEKNMECIQAGTTAATPLNTRSVTHGQELNDGTVKWKVRTDFRSLAGNYPDGTGNVVYPIATQAEAEAGEENSKMMTALRVKQAIDKLAPVKTINGEAPDETGDVKNIAKTNVVNKFVNKQTIANSGTGTPNEGGMIVLEKSTTTNLTNNVAIAIGGDTFRVHEVGGEQRGFRINLTACAGGIGTWLVRSVNGIEADSTGNIAMQAGITLREW